MDRERQKLLKTIKVKITTSKNDYYFTILTRAANWYETRKSLIVSFSDMQKVIQFTFVYIQYIHLSLLLYIYNI